MNINKLLIRDFDCELSKRKERRLKKELSGSEKLRRKKYLVEKLRIELFALKTRSFSPSFKSSLLEKIQLGNYPQIFFYREIGFAFKKFAFAGILLITFLVLYNFDAYGKIKLLSGEKIRLGEVMNNDYFYSVEVVKGVENGL